MPQRGMTGDGTGMGLLEGLAQETPGHEVSGLEEHGGSRPSLFSHSYQREERLASRLVSTLELARPFFHRFSDSFDITGRRRTNVARNLGGYRATGVVEPQLGSSLHRADAPLSLR